MRKGRRGRSGSEVPPAPAAGSGAERSGRPLVAGGAAGEGGAGTAAAGGLGGGDGTAAPGGGALGACQRAAEPGRLSPSRGSGRGGAAGARQDGGSVSVVGTGGTGLWRAAVRACPGRQVVAGRGAAGPVPAPGLPLSAGRWETRGCPVAPFLLPGKGEGLRAKGRTGAAAPRAVLRPQGLRWRVGAGRFRTGGVEFASALEATDTEPKRGGRGQGAPLLAFKKSLPSLSVSWA